MGWFRNKDSDEDNATGPVIDPSDPAGVDAPATPVDDAGAIQPDPADQPDLIQPDAEHAGQADVGQAVGQVAPDAPDLTEPGLPGEILPPVMAQRRPRFGNDLNQLPEIPLGNPIPAPIINPLPRAVVGPDLPCPNCSAMAPADAKFCEACGSDLVDGELPAPAPAPAVVHTEPCVSCGADPTEIDDGWCSACGTKQPAPRDHMEEDLSWLAAVTDKGLRHHHNEDAVAVAAVDGAAIIVVCDGVSTTERPEEASQEAADLIRDLLIAAVESGADVTEALHDAIEAAHHRVASLATDGPGEAPSCTVVAAVAERDNNGEIHATVAWLGDSRAFWVSPGVGGSDALPTVEQLTEDHSWARDQLAEGTLDPEAIAADARAHSITRWLGADSVDHTPDITTWTGDAGRLLVCSDGLWNYADDVVAMAARVHERAGTPLQTSRELVTFAKDSGGHDNISVVIVDFDLPQNETPAAPGPDTPTTEPTDEEISWADNTERDGDD